MRKALKHNAEQNAGLTFLYPDWLRYIY